MRVMHGMRDEYLRVVAYLCRQGDVDPPSDEFLRQRSQGGDRMPDFEQELFSFPEGEQGRHRVRARPRRAGDGGTDARAPAPAHAPA